MKQGFTLLELSIVLVIIGLIIGGVTTGQEMIRSAELNSVVSDVNQYKTALNTFKLKYNALPGDMDNAIDYWGAAHATPATCDVTASTGEETCNGNGDGRISGIWTESSRAWQHLANAGIISGSFNGTVDIPTTSITGSQFLLTTTNNGGLNLLGNYLGVGDVPIFVLTGAVDGDPTIPINSLTAPDAKSIDDKVDDGIADDGHVVTSRCNVSVVELEDLQTCGGAVNCSYDLASTAGCLMGFVR